MNRALVKQVCLEAGFKEKLQPDQTMDLNPYVYEAFDAMEARIMDRLSQMEEAARDNGYHMNADTICDVMEALTELCE